MDVKGPDNNRDIISSIDDDVKIFMSGTAVERAPERELDISERIGLTKTVDELMDLIIENGGIENENGYVVSPQSILSNIEAYISNISNALTFIPERYGVRKQVVKIFPGHGGEERKSFAIDQQQNDPTDNIVQLFPDGHSETIE